MNKTELVEAIATKAELSKNDSDKFIKAFVDVVTKTLTENEKVQIVGFGTFEVAESPERSGIIRMGDKKGEEWTKPACKRPKFKVGKALKDAVNGK